MINDLLTNINSTKYNIIFDRPKTFAISYFKIAVYNGDINHPLQKYWFFIPKAKIIEKTKSNIIIALSKNEDDSKLVNYIEELENKLFQNTKENLSKSIRKIKNSFSINNNYPPVIKLDISDDIAIFNYNEEEINQDDLEVNNLISVYLELENIIASLDETWIVWRILQIKKLHSIDFKKSFFKVLPQSSYNQQNVNNFVSGGKEYFNVPFHTMNKAEDLYNNNISTSNSPFNSATTSHSIPPPPPLPPTTTLSSSINLIKYPIPTNQNINSNNNQKNTISKFSISETDILHQINRLKKVKQEHFTNIEPNIDEIPLKITKLKKVETREPINLNDWFSNSIEMELFCHIHNGKNLDNEYIEKLDKLNKLLFSRIIKIKKKYESIIKLYENDFELYDNDFELY